MKAISVRLVHGKDLATVVSLVHALLDEMTGGQPPAIEEVTERAVDVLSGTGVVAVIAFVDDEPVGVMTLNACAAIHAGGKFGEFSSFVCALT